MINEKQELFMTTFQTLLLAHRTEFCNESGIPDQQQYSDLSNIGYQLRRAHEVSQIVPIDMDPFDAAHFLFWHHMYELDGNGEWYENAPPHQCSITCYWFVDKIVP